MAAFSFTTVSMAQVPSYVSSSGLVGWWPFNGNANDESGSGNNGTVNGATMTTDRFGVANKAYNFDGVDDYIFIPDNPQLNFTTDISYTVWYLANQQGFNSWNGFYTGCVLSKGLSNTNYGYLLWVIYDYDIQDPYFCDNGIMPHASFPSISGSYPIACQPFGVWTNFTVTFSNSLMKFYLNGELIQTVNTSINSIMNSNNNLIFGFLEGGVNEQHFNGLIDDIGIWNRALTECEVADLYNTQLGSFSNSSVSINPTSSTIGSNATLTVSTPIQSLQWQSNPGNMGWNNVVNNNNYSGYNNDTLVVSNVQLSNQNQPFRVLACGDTSNIATIQIADTCITNVTVFDTLLTTVTDTLIINTTLSLPAPNNENTILIYPNPASDHITIDNGNFTAMAGYSIKITNNSGQEVFLNAINQQQFYVDLSAWSGNGLYFVHLIDSQNNTVTVRKIVLQ